MTLPARSAHSLGQFEHNLRRMRRTERSDSLSDTDRLMFQQFDFSASRTCRQGSTALSRGPRPSPARGRGERGPTPGDYIVHFAFWNTCLEVTFVFHSPIPVPPLPFPLTYGSRVSRDSFLNLSTFLFCALVSFIYYGLYKPRQYLLKQPI